MDKYPLISVITTVYNTEKYVERCLESIMNQTYANIELVVVDNASTGNIKEIVEIYRKAYPNRNIKLLSFSENQGVFNARIKGSEIATGDYLAFIDSDDRVSIDFYRAMIWEALCGNYDIVEANVIYENQNGDLYYQNCNPFRDDFILEKKDVFAQYINQEGLMFSKNLIWNKVFSRKLWENAKQDLDKNQANIVMYDDMAIMSVLYYYANGLSKISSVQYYYYQNEKANSKGGNSLQKFDRILNDIKNAFNFIEEFLSRKSELAKCKAQIQEWKTRYFKVWTSEIQNSTLSLANKKILIRKLGAILNCSDFHKISNKDNFFYNLITNYSDDLECQLKKIVDPKVRVVSFDVFDTLIVRPFLEPSDLFILLSEFYNKKFAKSNYVDFKKIRILAEQEARKEYLSRYHLIEDINIDIIYNKIQKMLSLSSEDLCEIKTAEIELEKNFCQPRKIGKYLFDIAQYFGKTIICISDMYLCSKDIESILNKCGYHSINQIYVSSDIGLTKNTGSLYKYVLADLNISYESIVHIGDNFYSDIQMAKRNQIESIHLINAKDNLIGANKAHYKGNFTQKCYFWNEKGINALNYSGVRFNLGLVANKLFDNPFDDYHLSSDFNGSPYKIGYYVLGSYLLSVCLWLLADEKIRSYNNIHFIARDGFLFKTAYDIITDQKSYYPKSNYLHVSRKALFPLAISTERDLYTIHSFYNIFAYTPRKLLSYLSPIIRSYNEEEICNNMVKNHIVPDKSFSSLGEWLDFMNYFEHNIYNQDSVDEYRSRMRAYFSSMISPQDCTFDAGYSGRSESILGRLLNVKLDAYYLYANEERCFFTAKKNLFTVKTLHSSSASVPCMTILETIISELKGSCIGYDITQYGAVKPIYSARDVNYQSYTILSLMQKGAIDFIVDWNKLFGKIDFCYRIEDATIPLDCFFMHTEPFEKYLFSAAEVNDPLFFSDSQNLANMFDKLQEERKHNMIYPYMSIRNWKKAIILLLIDRKTLKEKVKDKLQYHPILLRICKVSYSIPRSLYHFIKR